jgi:hypothetical protein
MKVTALRITRLTYVRSSRRLEDTGRHGWKHFLGRRRVGSGEKGDQFIRRFPDFVPPILVAYKWKH